ncbi:hypothetical protein [Staphylococcus simulans]|uniref:Uncharacterized protein n=1 Tax=Staphylococcus simulans UMC-CNS-990 TaxID=1405498 RepID=A0ABP2YSQ3_STASI|nr:hypothetical protein [Staphylococcus simulans]ERS93136.1 hypothetical protein SSIM_07570 [Staphylococcus simulans UMC-CNS-990]PTJ46485.1 hypothetical protein BU014_08885 [Staphylococcus simulans]
MEFFQSSLFSNAIAFLALAASIYSIFYTHSQNKFRFSVTSIFIDEKDNYIDFSIVIVNNSHSSQVLKDLIFLDENFNAINPLKVDPEESNIDDNSIFNSEIFSNLSERLFLNEQLNKPELMLPNIPQEFNYIFYSVPKYIKIISNERINKFHKYVLISTDSYQHD